MPIYLGAEEESPQSRLWDDKYGPRPKGRARARTVVSYCAHCDKLAAVFLRAAESIKSLRCATCGGDLTTTRGRAAKLRFYEAIMKRNIALVIAAAHGDGDIEVAAEYAEYAAHTVFALRLVPYGPEPKR